MNKYFGYLTLFVLFLISFYLRIDAYLINNSFFTDEVLLFANIYSKNFSSLLAPLDYFQSAPYLFLAISKVISNSLGFNELCLRFIPFLSGLISVVMFYKLSKLVFNGKAASFLALFTFGINYQLLFYTQAFKQYSTDVLVIIAFLYYVIKNKDNILNLKQLTLFGIISFVGVFCSFPMIFVIPAVYATLWITKYKKIWQIIYSAIFPASALILYYIYNFRFLNNSEYLHTYWQKGFQIFSLEFYRMNFEFLFAYYSFPMLLVILILCGFYYLFKNNKLLFWIFFLTIFNIMIAAYLHIYPCERRLILFVLPIILILSFYPIDNFKKNILSYLTTTITLVFFFVGYFNFTHNFLAGNISYLRQDVKPLLSIIEHKQPEEKVYIYYGAISSYFYYSMIRNLPKDIYIANYPQDENLSEYYLENDLKNLPQGTYYLLFIKGTGTYRKDLDAIHKFLENNFKTESIRILKSTALIKVIKP